MQPLELAATGMEISIATLMLLFSGFLLLGSRHKTIPSYALATITGLIGMQVLLSTLGGREELQWLRVIKPPIALLIVPAIFIYVSRIRQDAAAIRPGLFLHGAPALGVIALITNDAGQFIDTYLNIFIGCYWVASVISFVRHRPSYKPATVERFTFWLIVIFGVVFILDVILSYQAQRIGNYREIPAYIFGLTAMLVGAARLMWTALQNPDLLAEPASGIKYARAGLDPAGIALLGEQFESLLESEKVYLNEDASLAQMADKLDTQPRHLSQMVNTRYGENFSAYINTRRVRDAAARLSSDEQNEVQITTIMYDTGFSSKSAFNREFKRQFGVSPKKYREQHRK